MIRKKIKKFLSQNWQIILVLVLAIGFFFLTSSYNFFIQSPDYVKFTSPDENANYVFSKLYAETQDLKIREDYNLYAQDIVKPRSFLADSGWLKPISFLGIILIYGSLASVLGVSILPFLTPVFASLALVFFYLFVKRLFGKKNALISTILLFSFPVYIYYSARSLFHNVLFVSLFIIFIYFLSLAFQKREEIKSKFLSFKISKNFLKNILFSGLGGTFLGLTIMTRTSELLWLAPVLLFLLIFYFKRLTPFKVVIFLGFLLLTLTPMFYWNQILYEGPLKFGYSQMNNSLVEMGQEGQNFISNASQGKIDLSFFKQVKEKVFHFGFRADTSIKSFYYYFVEMFPWIFWFAVIGMVLALSRVRLWKKRHWAYFLSWAFLSLFLIFYYGSWKFTDNPDPTSHTIGNSYTRYWLPVYLGALPLVSLAVIKITQAIVDFKLSLRLKKLLINGIQIVVVSLFIIKFMFFVALGSEEGLYYTALKYKYTENIVKHVREFTPYNSIIITQYHDKYLFPERKVIRGLLTDNNMNYYYSQLSNYLPLYYFNFTFTPQDVNYLNTRKLKEVGLNIEKVKSLSPEFSLYRLYKPNN